MVLFITDSLFAKSCIIMVALYIVYVTLATFLYMPKTCYSRSYILFIKLYVHFYTAYFLHLTLFIEIFLANHVLYTDVTLWLGVLACTLQVMSFFACYFCLYIVLAAFRQISIYYLLCRFLTSFTYVLIVQLIWLITSRPIYTLLTCL